jgi:hypothetical protein
MFDNWLLLEDRNSQLSYSLGNLFQWSVGEVSGTGAVTGTWQYEVFMHSNTTTTSIIIWTEECLHLKNWSDRHIAPFETVHAAFVNTIYLF